MISFPTSSWKPSLVQRTTARRPRNDSDDTHGRVVTAITPRLYLSDLYTARAAGNLERLGVTHIVSAIEPDLRKDFGDNVTIMHVPIRDDVNTNITQWFDTVVKFIREALDADEKHKVLVHCQQGISRSATLVCAYLVATTPMQAMEAIAHIQAKRGIVAPNIGFRRQLMAWERQFDDAKARAAEEQRKQARGMGVLVKALSKWVGKSKSRRLSKGRLHDPET